MIYNFDTIFYTFQLSEMLKTNHVLPKTTKTNFPDAVSKRHFDHDLEICLFRSNKRGALNFCRENKQIRTRVECVSGWQARDISANHRSVESRTSWTWTSPALSSLSLSLSRYRVCFAFSLVCWEGNEGKSQDGEGTHARTRVSDLCEPRSRPYNGVDCLSGDRSRQWKLTRGLSDAIVRP